MEAALVFPPFPSGVPVGRWSVHSLASTTLPPSISSVSTERLGNLPEVPGSSVGMAPERSAPHPCFLPAPNVSEPF